MALIAEALPARSAPSLEDLLQRAGSKATASPREAFADAAQAVALADASGDPNWQAAARQLRGELRRMVGQYEAALTDYVHAARLYRRAKRPADAARSDAGAVDCLSNLGRFGEAVRTAARARRVFRREGV